MVSKIDSKLYYSLENSDIRATLWNINNVVEIYICCPTEEHKKVSYSFLSN
jgi:hypothetical protein